MNKHTITAIAISAVAFGISVYNLLQAKETRAVFIDLRKVFESFEYKKQLQVDFDKTIAMRKQELEQMKNSIQMSLASKKYSEDTLAYLRQLYSDKVSEAQETNMALSKDLDAKIYKQLRQYIQDYVKSEHVEMVVCQTEDDLSVLGAGSDHTDEVIKFINAKFHDKK